MTRHRPTEAGFTLLEVLVALALTALLATALVGMVRLGTIGWERTAARVSATEGLVRADRTLRRQLAAMVPAGALGDIRGRPPLFFGAADGFGWVARTPAAARAPGLYGQRVRSEAGGGMILESWLLNDPARIDVAPLFSLAPIRFAYFGVVGPGSPPAWHARWAAGPIPPRLVRLRFPQDAGLPDLVYRLS